MPTCIVRITPPLVLAALGVLLVGCVSELDLTDQDGSGYACLSNSDCLSGFVCAMRGDPYGYGVCVGGDATAGDVVTDAGDTAETNVGPTCYDGERNGDETDVDCGGSCGPCPLGGGCDTNAHCVTGFCNVDTCELALIGMACDSSSNCATGFCGPLPDGTNVCGEPCSGGTGCETAGYICAGSVCVPEDLCVEQEPGSWAGPACDCATQCDPVATCTPTNGSLTCTCPTGFEPVGVRCNNVDECTTLMPCDENAVCADTDGSYTCECEPPWQGDGQLCTCRDIINDAGADQDLYAIGATATTLTAGPLQPWEVGSWSVYETSPFGLENTAVFGDVSDPNSTFSGESDIRYKLTWTVTNGCAEIPYYVHINLDPCYGERDVTDTRDSTVYPVAPLGGRCWMTTYLNVGTMITADNPVEVPQTDNGTIEKYCIGDDPAQCDAVGAHYSWDEAMNWGVGGATGICPVGFEIPTLADFNAIGFVSAYDALHEDEHPSATNTKGFNGRLLGRHDAASAFCCRTSYGYHWVAECPGYPGCEAWKLYEDGTIDSPYVMEAATGAGVRCLKSVP